jgi:predicted lactoylglutathione lyase
MSHLSLVTLGVADVESAAVFYEALGWRRSSASVPRVVAFLAGGTVPLSLFRVDDMAEDAGLPAPSAPPRFRAIACAANLASREGVDALMRRAASAGATVTRAARATEWGGYAGSFADPDGHLWEVAWNPGFPVDEDGRISLPD